MPKVKPKLSVFITVFNKAAWVSETITSILDQSFKDFELIIIDDGSTDSSYKVCEHWASKDPRVVLVRHTDNRGCSVRNNEAHALARAPIIVVMGADDIMAPGRLEITYKFFQKNPKKDVFYGSFIRANYKLEPIEGKLAMPFNKKLMLKPREDGYCPQYIGHFTMAYRTAMARKTPYREELQVGIDYPFICDLIANGAKFGWTKECLGIYRWHNRNVSHVRRGDVVAASQLKQTPFSPSGDKSFKNPIGVEL